jgi:hypothetical protein
MKKTRQHETSKANNPTVTDAKDSEEEESMIIKMINEIKEDMYKK